MASAQSVEKDEGWSRPLVDVPVAVAKTSAETGHAGCIHDFIACVRTGQLPETICTENIKSLALVFGAIESAQSGERIPIKI